MDYIDTADKRFHDGNGFEILGTIVPAKFLNAVMDEVINVIKAGGLTPSGDVDQLKKAITSLATSGLTAHIDAPNPHAQYLLRTDAENVLALRKMFIGIPLPFSLAAVPVGCTAMQGQAFDPAQYPILAQRYPDHIIPDLRGEFVRGWDNGRGIDSGRDLLSNQEDALQNIVGQIIIGKGTEGVSGSGAFSASNSYVGNSTHGSAGLNGRCVIDFNPALVARTADETRSRNISYNYICLLG